MSLRRLLGMLALIVSGAAAPAVALEAELIVAEPAGVARKAGVVTCGVPFAKGVIKDVAALVVQADGQPIPAQFTVLGKWPDGSVRWALMDCQLDIAAGGKARLKLGDFGGSPAPASPVTVKDSADEVLVSTGPLAFSISKKQFNLFTSLKVNGAESLSAGGRGLVLVAEDGKELTPGVPAEVRVESVGPLRAVVCVKGPFSQANNGLIGYTVRVTAYAGSAMLKVRVWLENHGAHGFKAKPEWFFFKGMAVELAPVGADSANIACESAKAAGSLRVSQSCKGGQWKNFAYRISTGDKELAKGERTEGIVSLSGKTRLTAGVRHFWQNYDKAIELDGGRLRLWLWPINGQWPRKLGQWDRGWDWAYKQGMMALPGGVAKGHEMVLDFTGRPASETAAELSSPLAAVNPDYFASTEAANILFAPAGVKGGDDDEFNWKSTFRDNMAGNLLNADNPTSLIHARTSEGNWYGWMDFGDVSSPAGGYYAGWIQNRSLHYDWTLSVLLHYARTGASGLLELGTQMAWHLQDVDQNWSDRDSAPYRALFRGDGSTPELHTSWSDQHGLGQPQPFRNWLSGVVLYYMLTGDPKAAECIERNYKGMQESLLQPLQKNPGSDVYRDDTLQAALLTIGNLNSLHDLTGDEKYLADIRLIVDNWLSPATKKHGPHMFDAGRENAGQGYQAYGQQLSYNIAALCMYHYRTRDGKVGSLLKAIAEKGQPTTFYESSLHFSDLYGYLGWLNKDDKLIDKAMRMFADGFPESRTPAIYSEGRANWTVRPPMMLRAGSILQYFCSREE